MKTFHSALAIVLSVILFSCNKELSFENLTPPVIKKPTIIGSWRFVEARVAAKTVMSTGNGLESTTWYTDTTMNNAGNITIDSFRVAGACNYKVDTYIYNTISVAGEEMEGLHPRKGEFAFYSNSFTIPYSTGSDSLYFPSGIRFEFPEALSFDSFEPTDVTYKLSNDSLYFFMKKDVSSSPNDNTRIQGGYTATAVFKRQ